MKRRFLPVFIHVFALAAAPGMFFGLSGLFADEIALSGVDARMTAITGDVSLYAVVTDSTGRPVDNLKADDFIVTDAPEGLNFGEPREVTRFSPAGERRDGLVFMLLIDDSGSMYDGPDGRPSPGPGQTRAVLARREARNFIDGLGSSLDRAGLAVFGTRYRVLAGPRTDRASLTERLGISNPPEPEEAYTELYAAITLSAGEMSSQKGRRIVILFSDGENYPYAERKGLPHPDYGEKVFTPDEALIALQGEGVTLYAVRFGPNRDADLARITLATGGLVFDVNGEEELTGLYSSIRERVMAEYRLDYRSSLTGAERTVVRVELAEGGSSSKLGYPSGFLFGVPATSRQALLSLLALPFALAVVVFLALVRSARQVEVPSLQRLRPFGGSAVTVALNPGRTVISPGPAGEATSIEPEGLKGRATAANTSGTIVVEKGKDGRWRAAGDQGVIVNNRKSNMTVLENGDVIRSGDELIVFDDGEN